MGPYVFTSKYDESVRDLVTPVRVCNQCRTDGPIDTDTFRTFNALWDTGAVISVISHQVVEQLGISPYNRCMATQAQGSGMVGLYRIDILLPNNLLVKNVCVSDGTLDGFDMIIGMDIIAMGDFAVTHPDGQTVFSFQIPSTHHHDYVKEQGA